MPSQLDIKMKMLENTDTVPAGKYIIARLDGRSFTRLAKTLKWRRPFDLHAARAMSKTVRELVDTGFKVLLAYTQSDEISLLIDAEDDTFNRRREKIVSTLAAAASATMSLALEYPSMFDCRLIETDDVDTLVKYFIWRRTDAWRNAINGLAHYMLIDIQDKTARQADRALRNMSQAAKLELLADIADIKPDQWADEDLWKLYGTLWVWHEVDKEGWNPIEEKTVIVKRRHLIAHPDKLSKEILADTIMQTLTRIKV